MCRGGGLASIIAKAMGRGPDLTAAESGEGVASFEIERALGPRPIIQAIN